MKNLPNRKERKKIEDLKAEIAHLNDEIKKKKQTNKLVIQRIKKQINTAAQKNTQLKDEHERLSLIV